MESVRWERYLNDLPQVLVKKMTSQVEDANGVANRSAVDESEGKPEIESGNLSAEQEIERINRIQKETRARKHGLREPEMTDEEFKEEIEKLSNYDLHPAHEHNIRNAKKVVRYE